MTIIDKRDFFHPIYRQNRRLCNFNHRSTMIINLFSGIVIPLHRFGNKDSFIPLHRFGDKNSNDIKILYKRYWNAAAGSD